VSNNVSNFYIKEWYNSSHDVTWSFQYNLSGNNKTDGGFTTFLALSTAQSNVGGGGESLGIGPKGIINKINGTVFCIAIDSSGLFGTKTTFGTGMTNPIRNSMIIRINNDLQFLTAFPLSSVGLDGLNTENLYSTIRINYTNVGQTLNIAKLNNNNEYETFYTYTGQFEKETSSPVRIGFSHVSPILPTSLKSRLTLKDIHTQGRYVYPKYNLLYEKIYDKFGNLIEILDTDGNQLSDELFDKILNNEDIIDLEVIGDDYKLLSETDNYLKTSPSNLNLNLSKESKLDGSLIINFEGYELPINIIVHPQTKYVFNNSDITSTIIAESNEKLSYQWYSNGLKVTNATLSTYVIKQITSTRSIYCVVSTPNGYNIASDEANIIVAEKPIIYTNPESKKIKVNDNVTLAISAKITAPLTYEWYVNDVYIPNSNSNTFRLNNLTSNKNVYCIVRNIAGFTKSKTATIEIVSPPIIITQPYSILGGLNQNFTYKVSATSDAPLTYKWIVNNITIPNTNQDTFIFKSGNVPISKSKSIYCEVSNIGGTVSSNIVYFTFSTGPIITSQPSNLIVKSGSSATFNVSAISTSEITYQWYDSGIIIPSANSNTYTITNATENKTLYCILTDQNGSIRSENISLIIDTLPTIKTQPKTVYINSGSNATFDITADSLTPLTYTWYEDNIPNQSSNTNAFTIQNITNTKTVYCKLSNLAGETQSNTVSAIIAESPTITIQPISVDIDQYTNTEFTIYVNGSPPFTFQWYSENILLDTETASSYKITNLTYDIDDIYCVVSNLVSSVTSNKVYAHLYKEPYLLGISPDLSAYIGSNVTVSVTAGGGTPLVYQWYTGNNLINDATLSSYTISNLTATSSLSCIVSNRIGSVSSDVVMISAVNII
jgi:hypothetical protein